MDTSESFDTQVTHDPNVAGTTAWDATPVVPSTTANAPSTASSTFTETDPNFSVSLDDGLGFLLDQATYEEASALWGQAETDHNPINVQHAFPGQSLSPTEGLYTTPLGEGQIFNTGLGFSTTRML